VEARIARILAANGAVAARAGTLAAR
jgi:hypothetical protein